jgi:formylglycine-generating enzyme required for sulfatase activity
MESLEELLLRWEEGLLEDGEAAKLKERLRDPANREALVAHLQMSETMFYCFSEAVKHGAPERAGNAPGAMGRATGRASPWRWAAALAASLAGLAAGGLIYRSIISPPQPDTANIAQHNGHSARRLAGHIAEILGTVEVRVGDEATSVAAAPGMALFEGSRVLTGDGGCRLALARGDVVVTVMASSELMLKGGGSDRQYDSEVNMTHGELQAEVRRKGTRFAVASVAGKAEAIGTAFKVQLQEQTEEKESKMNKTQMSMLTTVLSGVVLISNPFGTMTARAGDAVAVTPATAPERTVAGEYLVVDLSGGPAATNYPVGYLSAVPSGGWTDEHKTTKLVMRKIPAGTFIMGSPTNELGRYDIYSHETQHTVTLSRAFYLGVFEVTQRQWELVMGNKPSYFTNATCYATRPVERVSYYDIRESTNNPAMSPNWPETNAVEAASFMGKLRGKTGLIGFDLPTESQWEYACRAGTDTALNSGYNLTNPTNDSQMNVVGRYRDNGGVAISNRVLGGVSQGCETKEGGTAAAGTYQANAWGLYDMHGNVGEWCLDRHGTYPGAVTDPKGAASGSTRVGRGGCWDYYAYVCRSAVRIGYWPEYRNGDFGFRAAMTLP